MQLALVDGPLGGATLPGSTAAEANDMHGGAASFWGWGLGIVILGLILAYAATRAGRLRPVGVAVDKTGALLIADDAGNTVWRVTASGS